MFNVVGGLWYEFGILGVMYWGAEPEGGDDGSLVDFLFVWITFVGVVGIGLWFSCMCIEHRWIADEFTCDLVGLVGSG